MKWEELAPHMRRCGLLPQIVLQLFSFPAVISHWLTFLLFLIALYGNTLVGVSQNLVGSTNWRSISCKKKVGVEPSRQRKFLTPLKLFKSSSSWFLFLLSPFLFLPMSHYGRSSKTPPSYHQLYSLWLEERLSRFNQKKTLTGLLWTELALQLTFPFS